MLRCVTLVRTYVSEEIIAFFTRVKIIGALGTLPKPLSYPIRARLLVTANGFPSSPILITLMTEAISSSESSALMTTTRRHTPEDGILHSHRRENLKSNKEHITFRKLYLLPSSVECETRILLDLLELTSVTGLEVGSS
jgi:hypothetical protein